MTFHRDLDFSGLQIHNQYPKKHKFPLLKLPNVVLLECIGNLDVLEVEIDDESTYTLKEDEEYVNLIRSDGMIGSVFYGYAGNEGEKNLIEFMLQVWRRQT
ncbi:Protein CBG13797 [Caenorhabditis briggsae]|uniref:Protein CBG13797 n=1 Tax=Caenorhabditis briggsae TaxID=6238 RepID=A8XIQ4_CAEBR|nr:Protein CBG13797 [Caenorhabditis briggsae]CAP32529.2 Protein CBG13797 [Caenorhabditis briggsae]